MSGDGARMSYAVCCMPYALCTRSAVPDGKLVVQRPRVRARSHYLHRAACELNQQKAYQKQKVAHLGPLSCVGSRDHLGVRPGLSECAARPPLSLGRLRRERFFEDAAPHTRTTACTQRPLLLLTTSLVLGGPGGVVKTWQKSRFRDEKYTSLEFSTPCKLHYGEAPKKPAKNQILATLESWDFPLAVEQQHPE
jgi:hypothetical protein